MSEKVNQPIVQKHNPKMNMHSVKIKSIKNVTHDVLRIVTEKPQGYTFSCGQATEVSIKKDGWKDKIRPFTFTSLPERDYLEFTIKTYQEHQGVTNQLLYLSINDELILHEVFGAIIYKGEGLFIAGGAGITPFVSILRELGSTGIIGENKLLFANKTKNDIIYQHELKKLLGANFINILSEDKIDGYHHGYITEKLLSKSIPSINSLIYLCGPEPMMESMENMLKNLAIDTRRIVKEKF